MPGKDVWVCLLFLSLISLAKAQVIRGVVRDEGLLTLQGVAVTAHKADQEKLLAFNTSDVSGQYQLRFAKRDTTGILIKLNHVGYKSIVMKLGRLPQKDTTISFTMQLNQRDLDTVAVKERRKKMDTTSFSTDSLRKLYHQNIQQLLLEIPGLILVDNKFVYKGKVISKVLFEGDNLTNENYQHLLKSLSPHSLDSIQLIENFVDKTELGNSYKRYGEEVVLNFKFKGKKKVRNFGRLGAGLGFQRGIFEGNTDNLSLIRSLKMVNIGNYNSKGLVTDYLFEKSGSYLTPHVPGLFSHLTKSTPPLPIIPPYTISPEHIGIERIYSNRSAFLTSDIFNRINQKLFFKGNIRGVYDKLPQMLQVSTIFLDSNFVSTKSTENSTKRNVAGALEGSINWLASPKIQVVSSIGLSVRPVMNNAQNNLNGEVFSQFYKNNIKTTDFRQNLTWLSSNKFILKAEVYVGSNSLKETSNNTSNIYADLITNDAIASVFQNIQSENKYAGAGVNANIRLSRSTTTATNVAFAHKNSIFKSNLNAYDGNSSQVEIVNGFENDILEKRTDLYLENETVRTGKLFSNHYTLRMTNLINLVDLSVEKRNRNVLNSLDQRFHWSPRLGISYELPSQSSIGFEMFVSRIFPLSGSSYDGLLLYDQNRFRSGFDTLRVLVNPGLSVNWRKQAGIKFFSISYTFSRTPVQQTQSFGNNGIFIYTSPQYLENPARSHSLHMAFLVYFSKTTISLNSYQSFGKSQFIINQKEISTNYLFSTQSLKINSQLGKHVNNSLNTNLNIFTNRQKDPNNNIQNNKSSNISITHEFNLSFLRQFTASLLQKGILLNGSNSKGENYYFLDSKISHTSKSNRITAYLECRNILNKNKYSTIQQDLFVQVQTYSTILPRLLMAGIEVKL